MASSDPSGDDDEREVFGSLPKTRPQRRSPKRDRPSGAAKAAPAAAARPKAEAAPKAKPKAAKPRAKAAAPPPKAAAPPVPVPPAGYATPRPEDGVPHGAQLVTTAVQAAGELAQIGIAAGGRALKSALQRLPKP